MSYSIVLPCYNEAPNLPLLVERFRNFAGKWDFELILVNNGSTDNSAEVLAEIQAVPGNSFVRVVNIAKNLGYGHGLHTGLDAARGDILAFSHADIQTPPEDVFRAFNLWTHERLPLRGTIVKGLRPGREAARRLTRWLRYLTAFCTGVSLEDINGQPKVFHRSLLAAMERPVQDFSYDTYVLYLAIREGWRVKTLEVAFEPRLHGESKWAGTFLKKSRTIISYIRSIFLMSWRDRRRKDNPLGQLLRFGLAGLTTNLVNYLTFFIFLRPLGVNYLLASVSGFFAGFMAGFFLNKHYTFGVPGGELGSQLAKFLLVNLMSLGANTLTIFLAVQVGGNRPELGQLLAILASALVNFSGMKWWVFTAGGAAHAGDGAEI